MYTKKSLLHIYIRAIPSDGLVTEVKLEHDRMRMAQLVQICKFCHWPSDHAPTEKKNTLTEITFFFPDHFVNIVVLHFVWQMPHIDLEDYIFLLIFCKVIFV